MKNNMMKLVVCTGFVCGTSFGMEKEQIIPSAVHNKFYVEYKNVFYRINQDGSHSQVEDSVESIISSSQKFKDGRLVNFNFKNQKCYVEGDSAYGVNVAVKKEQKIDARLNTYDFSCTSVECTNDQLKEMVRLIEIRQGRIESNKIKDGKVYGEDGKEYSPFVLDEYNFRIDIEAVAAKVQWMVEELKDNAAKKEADNSELSKK